MHLATIFPTWEDWARWFILFTAGFIMKPIYDTVRDGVRRELRRERRRIVKLHVRELHPKAFWHCHEGACKFLRLRSGNQGSDQLPQAAAAAELGSAA